MPRTLDQLLRETDVCAAPPRAPVHFAPLIRRRRARQQTIRHAALAAAILISASLAAFLLRPRAHHPIAGTEPSLAVPQATPVSLASLELRAQLHELTAQRLLKSHSARRPIAASTPLPESEIQFQRERAALILVYDADLHVKQNRPNDAIASYRRAVELFPDSHWASVARQRLKEMPT